ncbi:MAG TPA: biotin--[acetyl-CoA-carboxylase] ligase [Candidatus Krumholzibacteria bacterium]|nr:biotin--[acetyl-CoA-carboxylase] ligase [Candidatus Krumholzibacteria bacterium]
MHTPLDLPTLKTSCFGRTGRFYSVVDSTNQRLLEWAVEGAPHGASVLAAEQTAGRGRQGRSWQSEAGCGLFGSLLLRPERSLAGSAAFSLVTALAVADTLNRTSDVECAVKWPNDLTVDGKKLAGILLEARGGQQPFFVVGLGLNLKPPASGWAPQLDQRAISLAEISSRLREAHTIWAEILNRLERMWERFRVQGFGAFTDEWHARDTLRGQRVRVQSGDSHFHCQVEGVDSEGRLRVRLSDASVLRLEAGEVHLHREGEE